MSRIIGGLVGGFVNYIRILVFNPLISSHADMDVPGIQSIGSHCSDVLLWQN